MIDWAEKSVFLRPLNYIRIKHDYSTRYNWIYPSILTAFLYFGLIYIDDAAVAFGKSGLIAAFTPLLSILAPFYIGALGAVSTFSGNDSVDKAFTMKNPVLLKVIGSGGAWENIHVTPRHFLSLLFGYSTAVAIFLVIFTIFMPIFAPAIQTATTYSEFIFMTLLCFFLFLFSQIILGTLLGVYFLADQLHRRK